LLPFSSCRLDDFENSCAAYDKSLELADDYFTHLNYTITLYKNDEIEKARKQFLRFETVFRSHAEEADVDSEVKVQTELLRKVLFTSDP
jgi:Bardet-Biedl syndrome 4 protein